MSKRRPLTGYPPEISEPYYFGCWGELGHYVHDRAGRHIRNSTAAEWLRNNDGRLCPDLEREFQGVTVVRVWPDSKVTVLSFWDRSVDDRGNSSSTFMLPGVFTFEEAIAEAKKAFPTIWVRYTFEVRLPQELEN